MPEGLYANMNARKKKGISRSKKDSTISDKAYKNMKAGFPKKKTLLKKVKEWLGQVKRVTHIQATHTN